jgi:maltose alpha-D-glucosyltransferase/alpha-amylase
VRRGPREGALVDAVADRDFVSWLIKEIHQGRTHTGADHQLEFRPTERFAVQELPPIANVRLSGAEQSNSSVLVDASFVLKFYRRLSPGSIPEVDIGRFLTDVAGFANAPPLLGTIELLEKGERSTVAVLHGFVDNQGDAWEHTTAYLDRFLDEASVLPVDAVIEPDHHAGFLNRVRQIGRRTAELHLALASAPQIAEFAPEPITSKDISGWTEQLVANAERVFDELTRRRERIDARAQYLADLLLSRRAQAIAHIRGLLPDAVDADKVRLHGDFHLGQILLVKDDVHIIDFEGEPRRSSEERHRKAPAARDAAGFIRSLDYAATTALNRMLEAAAEDPVRLMYALDAWRAASTQTFLASLRATAGDTRLWPKDDETADRLLRFFIVEKAVYELGYEFANRPDWVRVPLAGLWRTLFPAESAAP